MKNHKKPAAIKKSASNGILSRFAKFGLPLIMLLTAAIYFGGIRSNKMMKEWDDTVNVVDNKDIHALTLDNVKKWFTTHYITMYCPVKEAVYAIEYALWGGSPQGFHAFALLLHCINILLVFRWLFLLTKRREGALFAALLFAVHPMAVESVAWVSTEGERLFTLFYLCALINYHHYLESRNKGATQVRYLLFTFGLFLLSALSKVSAVTLPVMLMLVDWYSGRKLFAWKALREKFPFFAAALALGLVVVSERSAQALDAQGITEQFQTLKGYIYSLYSASFYIVKFVAPFNQSVYYPHPLMLYGSAVTLPYSYYLYPLALLAAGVLIWRCKPHRRKLLFGFGFFLIAVAPTLQIVPVGGCIANDRYTYLPYIGFFFLIAYAYGVIQQKGRRLATARCVLCCAAALMAYRSHALAKLWYDDLTIFLQYRKAYPEYSDPHQRLAREYANRGNFKQALQCALQATQVEYVNSMAFATAGQFLLLEKRYDEARQYLDHSLRLDMNNQEAWINKAKYFMVFKQPDSIDYYVGKFTETVYAIHPLYRDDAAQAAAYAAFLRRDYANVIQKLKIVETLRPLERQEYVWRYNARYALGGYAEALGDLDALAALAPQDYGIMVQRINLLCALQRYQEAWCGYRKLQQQMPDNADLRLLGGLFEGKTNLTADCRQYEQQ